MGFNSAFKGLNIGNKGGRLRYMMNETAVCRIRPEGCGLGITWC